MDKATAKLMLDRGIRIKHEYFCDGEFIEKRQGILKDEKGYIINEVDFWNARKNDAFDSGWSNFVS